MHLHTCLFCVFFWTFQSSRQDIRITPYLGPNLDFSYHLDKTSLDQDLSEPDKRSKKIIEQDFISAFASGK